MERVRTFNIHGICYPDRHYMVDLGGRLREIKKMIDRGEYFVINRARQYGKTTLLHALKEYLRPDYAVISMSFQKMSTAKFEGYLVSFSEDPRTEQQSDELESD